MELYAPEDFKRGAITRDLSIRTNFFAFLDSITNVALVKEYEEGRKSNPDFELRHVEFDFPDGFVGPRLRDGYELHLRKKWPHSRIEGNHVVVSLDEPPPPSFLGKSRRHSLVEC